MVLDVQNCFKKSIVAKENPVDPDNSSTNFEKETVI